MNKILLKGIFIDHLLNKGIIENDKLPETIIETDNLFWDELEKKHIDNKVQENQIELACWCCGLFFEETPWGIPIFTSSEINIVNDEKYELHNNLLDSVSRKEKKHVKYMGNFCSVCCAIRFLNETSEIPDNCKDNYRNLLYYIYEQKICKKITFIPMAHPKHKMSLYSGKDGWSEQEFKEKNKQLERQFVI